MFPGLVAARSPPGEETGRGAWIEGFEECEVGRDISKIDDGTQFEGIAEAAREVGVQHRAHRSWRIEMRMLPGPSAYAGRSGSAGTP